MKRLFDIIASGCGLLILSPVLIAVAIWIKIDSKGPVFYRQIRVGRNNKDFKIFKFRSMRIGSDKGSLVTIGGRDPRVTRSGYYIRKYKLDELRKKYKIKASWCKNSVILTLVKQPDIHQAIYEQIMKYCPDPIDEEDAKLLRFLNWYNSAHP